MQVQQIYREKLFDKTNYKNQIASLLFLLFDGFGV